MSRSARLLALLALVAAAGVAAVLVGVAPATDTAGTPAGSQQLVLYASLETQTFVNNQDDRARGKGNNPFGNYRAGSTKQPTDEKLDGPFAGDEGLFSYTIYAGAKLETKAGSAVLVCQYAFAQKAFCDVSYKLESGSLIGAGVLDSTAASFTLPITGGTGAYRGAKGDVEVTLAGTRGAGTPAVLVLASQRLRFLIERPKAASTSQSMAPFSVATKEQFIDNAEDMARGSARNPFGARSRTATAPRSGAAGPGDEALFVFRVYANADLKKRIGSATFTCQYTFDTDAFCNASYALADGTLIGAGAFGFDATDFRIAITGGTGKYSDATGELEASPSADHAQRLTFSIGSA